MSDTQKLTPALSTPGRDLLRREIYKGLADRAAGRVKDLDVDAILAKGKELFQKRSISNVRQFGVGGRKTLFLLLLLFASPADGCSAQTPPPPVDERVFERVPPTRRRHHPGKVHAPRLRRQAAFRYVAFRGRHGAGTAVEVGSCSDGVFSQGKARRRF